MILIAAGLVVLVVGIVLAFLFLRGGSETAGGEDPDAVTGSLTNPYPFEQGVVVFYDNSAGEELRWVVQVLDPVEDATQQLVSEAAATPPSDGEVYAQTRVRLTYQSGPDSGDATELHLAAIGNDGEQLTTDDAGCPNVLDPLDTAVSLDPAGAVEGNLCWQVPAAELGDLTLAVEAAPADGTVHLSLQGGSSPAEPSEE
jgi:hypothetical protein